MLELSLQRLVICMSESLANLQGYTYMGYDIDQNFSVDIKPIGGMTSLEHQEPARAESVAGKGES